jgi:hypothetical protein
MRDLPEVKFPLLTDTASDADDRKPIDDANEAILSALSESSFAPGRKLSRLTHLPPTIVYRRLSQSLRFGARHLLWVPHVLSDAPKAQ